jgi:hypothetical protein
VAQSNERIKEMVETESQGYVSRHCYRMGPETSSGWHLGYSRSLSSRAKARDLVVGASIVRGHSTLVGMTSICSVYCV